MVCTWRGLLRKPLNVVSLGKGSLFSTDIAKRGRRHWSAALSNSAGVRCYTTCALVEYRGMHQRRCSAEPLSVVRGCTIVVFDEAQVVPDIGGLFENVAIVERLIYLAHTDAQLVSRYSWRTFSQQEADYYLEERNNALPAHRFKWSPRRASPAHSRSLSGAYPTASFTPVTSRRMYTFITATD